MSAGIKIENSMVNLEEDIAEDFCEEMDSNFLQEFQEVKSSEPQLQECDKLSETVHASNKTSKTKTRKYQFKSNKPRQKQLPKSRETKFLNCPLCSKKFGFRHYGSLEQHMRIHTGEKPFLCESCGKSFINKAPLKKHLRFRHGIKEDKNGELDANVANEFASTNRIFFCDLCCFQYRAKYRYLRHLKDIHLNKEIKNGHVFRFYFCDAEKCLNSYTTLNDLHSHMKHDHHCASTNTNNLNEESNIELDSFDKVFKCKTCGRQFAELISLTEHQECHKEGGKKLCCDYCHVVFNSDSELLKHKPRHEILFDISAYCHLCDECGESFTDVKMLRKHQTQYHMKRHLKKRMNIKYCNCKVCGEKILKKLLQPHMETHQSTLRCKWCEFEAADALQLRKHKLLVHKYTVRQQRRTGNEKGGGSETVTRRKVQECPFCSEKYRTKLRIRRHLVEKHPEEHLESSPYVCKRCWEIFATDEERKSHRQNIHAKCICTVEGCSKGFLTNAHLKKHLNVVHSNPEPFICSYCSKKFSDITNFNSHVRVVHLHQRSYKCRLCPEHLGFVRSREVEKHVEKQHPGVFYKDALFYDNPRKSAKRKN